MGTGRESRTRVGTETRHGMKPEMRTKMRTERETRTVMGKG